MAGSYGAPGALIFAPRGFQPLIALRENDFALSGGLKGNLAGFDWDLNSTFGRDASDIYTRNSANESLFIDTHATPTDVDDGAFTSSQWTNALDIASSIDLGLAEPLNLAFGGEYRRDTCGIKSGDAGSIYKEGPQAYPGFQPTDAGTHRRSNAAAYMDLALSPVTGLKLDGAVRFEHYTDFGDTTVGRITARYDLSPAFALRGTFATGFRAPTLAEEYYSATNMSPSSATLRLPANSAAARLLGSTDLRPEKSKNYSVGFVAHPAPRLVLTTDSYQIDVTNRIVATGDILAIENGQIVSPAVLAAISAHGNTIDSSVGDAAVN